jgi:tellurite resistance protein
MHIQATPDQARAILKAMFAIAAVGPLTEADRASIVAAARYIFRLDIDASTMTAPAAADLQLLAADPALANEAVSFATVMAFVDGTLDNKKLTAVLALAAKLGVKQDFVDDVAKLAQGHLHDATAHMIRANLESVIGHPVAAGDETWFLPYKNKADPALAARFHALANLPANSFGNAFATFYKANKYAFPGEPTGLNFTFAAPHDSSHVLAGYDTSPRGELLVSTFTAAMHRKEAMAGHVLPVILSFHLGITLVSDVAGSARGALDPKEFWHAWARGEAVTTDLFGPSFDFWAATAEPIDALRSRLGLDT